VDLLSDVNNKIEFKAGVRSNDGGELKDCLQGDENLKNSYDNV
jgi:hypothetical protein